MVRIRMAELLFADNFRSEGEEQAAKVLGTLPADWLVICNKWVTSRYDGTFEVDFIVVGSKNVFVVDEKSWRGGIRGSDQNWVVGNKEDVQNPLNKLELVARLVSTKIRYTVPRMWKVPRFVTGCVLLSVGNSKPLIRDERLKDQVIMLPDVVEHLTALDQTGLYLVGQERTGIKNCLYDLRHRPKTPERYREYQIVGTLPAPDDPRVNRYRAKHDSGLERELTVYRLGVDMVSDRRFFLRETEVLRTLSDTGLSPAVDPYLENTADRSIAVPTTLPEGTPYGELNHPTSDDDILDELKKSETILSGLSTIHSRGIIHRRLDLRNIYLQERPEGYGVTFTSFWAARSDYASEDTGENTIFGPLDTLRASESKDGDGPAPELQVSYELADETTDTYMVGSMLLSRILGGDLDEVHGDDGGLILPESADLSERLGSEISNDLQSYFRLTLGRDPVTSPGPGTGRLTATQSLEIIQDVIRKLEMPGRFDPLPESVDEEQGDEVDVVREDDCLSADHEAQEEDAEVRNEGLADRSGEVEGSEQEQETGFKNQAISIDNPVGDAPESSLLEEAEFDQELPSEPRDRLVLRYGSVRLEITPDGVSIGREPSNDLVLDDGRVSRNHAIAIFENGRFRFTDKDSTNGTLINGESVGSADLAGGDVIRVGGSEITVESELPADLVCPSTDSSCKLGCGEEISCIYPVEDMGSEAISWKLTLLSGPQDGSEFVVSTGIIKVGRSSDNDIVLESPSISRKHVNIIVEPDDFAVEDVGSSNGTWVDGSRVNIAILGSGDTFLVGDTSIKVERLAE